MYIFIYLYIYIYIRAGAIDRGGGREVIERAQDPSLLHCESIHICKHVYIYM